MLALSDPKQLITVMSSQIKSEYLNNDLQDAGRKMSKLNMESPLFVSVQVLK